ncbi:FtsL-like putative cell division protein [Blattabacterium cuenoti]|uniref:FtsL-like putative cell division protein n=1 Tax=Blattabacterium cuenoti TaxID=1653831 RepID=UPI00163C8F8C|nr:FtsL-like putative cell division protein [Blattabacterium cuenoti]
MKKNIIIRILTGKFLVDKNAYQVWYFLIYITFLSFISITNSHLTVYQIQKCLCMKKEVEELHAEYADVHHTYMKMKFFYFLHKKDPNILKTFQQSTSMM